MNEGSYNARTRALRSALELGERLSTRRDQVLGQLVFCEGCCCGRVDRGFPALPNDIRNRFANGVVDISKQVGTRAVEVDAVDELARSFYLQFGFRPLLDDPRHLFLPIHEIRKLKLDPLP